MATQQLSKRQKAFGDDVLNNKDPMPIQEALVVLERCATAKCRETVEIAVRLGIDAKKSDQVVRGSVVLPHGTGRIVKVAVFAQDDDVKLAKDAGADRVGMEDLAEEFERGKIGDINVVIATPSAMPVVGKLGQILGPRGLMPNPKVGTVTTDVSLAVKNAKQGQVRYRNDKNGIIHCLIGKADFKASDLLDNLTVLLMALKKAKPNTAKGAYFRKLTISSTFGPGVLVDLSTIAGLA